MILSTMVYIQKEGKVLLLHRTKKQNDTNEGKYLGVGGRFEANESPDDCIYREVREETGLIMNSFAYRGVVTFVSDTYPTEYMFIYTCDDFSGEMIECNEGDLYWVEKEKMFDLPMWAGDRLFLERMEKSDKPFSMKVRYVGDTLAEAYDGIKKLV